MKGTGVKLFYIVIAAILLVVYFSNSTLRNIFRLKSETRDAEEKLTLLKKENQDLQKELRWLKEGNEHIKQIAREKLGFLDSEEKKVYIIEK